MWTSQAPGRLQQRNSGLRFESDETGTKRLVELTAIPPSEHRTTSFAWNSEVALCLVFTIDELKSKPRFTAGNTQRPAERQSTRAVWSIGESKSNWNVKHAFLIRRHHHFLPSALTSRRINGHYEHPDLSRISWPPLTE